MQLNPSEISELIKSRIANLDTGATVRTEIPDGKVDLRIAPGTVSGGRLRLKGRGLPRADGTRGDLYAVVRIEVPAATTPEEAKAYEALRDAAHAPKDRPAGA